MGRQAGGRRRRANSCCSLLGAPGGAAPGDPRQRGDQVLVDGLHKLKGGLAQLLCVGGHPQLAEEDAEVLLREQRGAELRHGGWLLLRCDRRSGCGPAPGCWLSPSTAGKGAGSCGMTTPERSSFRQTEQTPSSCRKGILHLKLSTAKQGSRPKLAHSHPALCFCVHQPSSYTAQALTASQAAQWPTMTTAWCSTWLCQRASARCSHEHSSGSRNGHSSVHLRWAPWRWLHACRRAAP